MIVNKFVTLDPVVFNYYMGETLKSLSFVSDAGNVGEWRGININDDYVYIKFKEGAVFLGIDEREYLANVPSIVGSCIYMPTTEELINYFKFKIDEEDVHHFV